MKTSRDAAVRLVGCVAVLLFFTAPVQAMDGRRANVIVIFSDDHGYADLSCQGIRDDVRTPNLDRLAAEGVRMTSGYVSAPQCVPSRAGLLTGRYQNRFGVESNGMPLDGFNSELTIAERLKQAGYATGMSGKWHLGPAAQIVQHGFDDVYYKHSRRAGWANFGLDGNPRDAGPENTKLYHVDANTEAACAFIRRHRAEPFFFYCAYRAPHVPLDAPEKYLSRFPGKMPERRRQALAMISAIDDGVGRIMATLAELKLEEKTLVFFIGDNGAPLKIHKLDAPGGGPGWDGSLNEPLNGEKGMLSEGGIRVPFVAAWKGQFHRGREFHHPVISLDVAATALAVAGLPVEPGLDGVDLTPFLRGNSKEPPHSELYWRWIAQAAVRSGRWKYLRGGTREYLFDVEKDREEKHNLLQEHPDVAKRLAAKLEAWSSELKPAGVTTKPMSRVWEDYYDHYLDGKPAKPPTRTGAADRIAGWVVRNGSLKQDAGGVRIVGKGKKRPFIANAGLKLPKHFTAVVSFREPVAGAVSVAWREAEQKDFPRGQSVSSKCDLAGGCHEHKLVIAADQPVIHLRVSLPPGGANLVSIETLDDTGGRIQRWQFPPN